MPAWPRIKIPKLVIPQPPLQEFTLFPELPRELRNRVWFFASSVSRDVSLLERNRSLVGEPHPGSPALLSASRESREEAKRYYTLCRLSDSIFIPTISEYTEPAIDGNTIWVNFDVDRFVFSGAPVASFGVQPLSLERDFKFDLCALKKIQYLVIERYDTKVPRYALRLLAELLSEGGNMRRLTLRVLDFPALRTHILSDNRLCRLVGKMEQYMVVEKTRWNWNMPVSIEIVTASLGTLLRVDSSSVFLEPPLVEKYDNSIEGRGAWYAVQK
jgi:2EXR family